MLLAVAILTAASATPAAAASKYAAIIIDANSGDVLHSSNADEPRYPASLTKMMTLYVVFEMIENGRLQLDGELIITPLAASQQPTKLGLAPGSRIAVRDAIAALVTRSANDIAVAIAENIAGTEEKFARYMTWRAHQLGMTNTTFRNASGLPNWEQKTTARDMATLGLALMDDFPQHYRVFSQKTFRYRGKNYHNHNGLLRNFEGTDGIKTGYIRASGFNLVASVKRGPKRLVGVVMGGATAGKRNANMRSILSSAFRKASSHSTRLRRQRIPVPVLVSSRSESGLQHHTAVVQPAAPQPRLASAATSPSSAFAGIARSPTTKPQPASFTAPQPERVVGDTANGLNGPYHVQVGAFGTLHEAQQRLGVVRENSGTLLAGRDTLTMRYVKGSATYFRARFAGFARSEAVSTCDSLKSLKIDCVAMIAR